MSALDSSSLAFTWCQVPVVYTLDDSAKPALTVVREDGTEQTLHRLALSVEDSQALFERTGAIRALHVTLNSDDLFSD